MVDLHSYISFRYKTWWFKIFIDHIPFKVVIGAPPVAQWYRIHLPMQEAQVPTLIQEDSTHMPQSSNKPLCASMLNRFSRVRLCATCPPGSSVHGTGFSRQEYWSGLPCPPPGGLPDPGVESGSPVSFAVQASPLPLSNRGSRTTSLGHNYWACALPREATAMRSLWTTTREEPPLGATREKPVLQQRHSPGKNKLKKKNFKIPIQK